jgi:hypothetical protein
MVSFNYILLLCSIATSGVLAFPFDFNATELVERAGTPSGTGTSNGYFYSFYTDGGGTVNYANGAGGSYTTSVRNIYIFVSYPELPFSLIGSMSQLPNLQRSMLLINCSGPTAATLSLVKAGIPAVRAQSPIPALSLLAAMATSPSTGGAPAHSSNTTSSNHTGHTTLVPAQR